MPAGRDPFPLAGILSIINHLSLLIMSDEITYRIDAFLQDNSLTTDNTEDVYAVPASKEPADEERILAEMKAEDTGLRRETLLHVFELQKRVIKRLLLSGHAVNTGLWHASVAFRGLIKKSQWDPEENEIVVNFNAGADLREALKHTQVNILGAKPASISVTGMEDVATKADNASATPGRAFTLTGKNLRIAGTDPSVGLTLVSEDGTETPVPSDLWVINNPSTLTFIIPADLEQGTYTLRVTTQFSGHSTTLLKTPRSTETTLYIGTEPPTSGGNDDDETTSGSGNDGSFG